MTHSEEKMLPADALRLIKRLRAVGPCKISLQFDTHMPTEDGKDRVFPSVLNGVTMQQVAHLLEDMDRIRETMRTISDTEPLVNVKVHGDENSREKLVVLG